MKTNIIMSPWFKAMDYRPLTVGPYECKMTDPAEDGPTHMRWFDGDRWSMPLQEEHEDLNGAFTAPSPTYYLAKKTEAWWETTTFAWRGFNEDQEPL